MLLFFNPGINKSIKASAQNKGLNCFSCPSGFKGTPVPGDSKELDCTQTCTREFYFRLCLFEREGNEERERSPSTKEGSTKPHEDKVANTALSEPDAAEHPESVVYLHVN